jgi:hypothetical protein
MRGSSLIFFDSPCRIVSAVTLIGLGASFAIDRHGAYEA